MCTHGDKEGVPAHKISKPEGPTRAARGKKTSPGCNVAITRWGAEGVRGFKSKKTQDEKWPRWVPFKKAIGIFRLATRRWRSSSFTALRSAAKACLPGRSSSAAMAVPEDDWYALDTQLGTRAHKSHRGEETKGLLRRDRQCVSIKMLHFTIQTY